MYVTNELDHLRPHKEAICAVSGQVSGRLRYIRNDLEPLISQGVPIKHLTRLLSELGITNRKNSVRDFIKSEYPDFYTRYYAKNKVIPRNAAPSTGNGEVPVRPAEESSLTKMTSNDPASYPQKETPSSLLSELTTSMRRGQAGESHADIDD